MVSTITPKYLPLIATHGPWVVILILALIRLGVRWRSGAPALPADLPGPMKLAAHLSHYLLYGLMIVMPLLGWAMLSAADYPVVLLGGLRLPPILPQSDRLHTLLVERAPLSRLPVLRGDPAASRGGAVPCARPARRRVRGHGGGADARAGSRAPAGGIGAYCIGAEFLRVARPLLHAAGKVARRAGWGEESRDGSMKARGDGRAMRPQVAAAGHTPSGPPDQSPGSRHPRVFARGQALPQQSWRRIAPGLRAV